MFVGAIGSDYALVHDRGGLGPIGHHTLTGTHRGMIANRLSHTLGLRGPSLTVDSGQSSSLVSVQMAMESLRRGESEAALAGGVNLVLVPESTESVARFGGLSPDARCHTFDSRANGYVRGEGGVLVVLKTLAGALADGDRIHAVLHGGAVGHSSPGDLLTRPTVEGQEEVIRRAYADAGKDTDQVAYVELHGTGTPVGDPVEAAALGGVFGRGGREPLRVGSVKTNIGHLEGAAGIVGLLKTVLSLEHQLIPRNLNYAEPNPRIDLDGWGLSVQTRREPWPRHAPLAGVSSFGMGGTNCHLVLGPAPAADRAAREPVAVRSQDPVPWVLSARSAEALRAQASALHAHVSAHPGVDARDIGLSLVTTRDVFEHRAVVFAPGDESQDLESVRLEGRTGAGSGTSGAVMVFSGQDGQWEGMARDLLDGEGLLAEVFTRRLRSCERALEPYTDWSVSAVLRGESGAPSLRGESASADVVQPVMWAVMVSLARVWEALGVEPGAVVGDAQGEPAAACVAGALSLEEAARVVALRGRAVTSLSAGTGTAALGISAEEAERMVSTVPDLHVSAVNGPESVVVAGGPGAVDEAVRRCSARGVSAEVTNVDHTCHPGQVDRVRGWVAEHLGAVRCRTPEVPFYSTLVGARIGADGPALDTDYWHDALREPVLLAPAVDALIADGHRVLIEVAPAPVLSRELRGALDRAGVSGHVLETLRRGSGDHAQLLGAAARAFTAGVDVDWTALFEGTGAHRTDLPTYQFQRERFWPPTTAAPASAAPGPDRTPEEDLLGPEGLELADGRTVFTGTIDGVRHPWTLEHRLLDRTLLPGTAMLTLVLRAAAAVGAPFVDELALEAPLVLSGGRSTSVQVTVEAPDARGGREVTVHSRGQGQGGWVRHARGSLGPEAFAPGGGVERDRPLFEGRAADFDPEEGYARLGRRGYDHGELFRGLREVRYREEALLARVALPEDARTSPTGARSALLDSALHAVLLFGAERDGTMVVPRAWNGVRVREEGAGPAASVADGVPTELFVTLEPLGSGRYRLGARDGDGRSVLEVDELVLRPVGAGDLPTSPDEEPGRYRLRWEQLRGPLAQTEVPAGVATMDVLESPAPVPAVVYAELPAPVVYADQDPVPTAAYQGLESALETVRTWLADERTAHSRLALVTWRSVATSGGDRLSGLAAAPVWGLLRSIQREHPGRLVLVDSDGSEESHRVLAAAVGSGEPQTALRCGRVLVPRLAESADEEMFVPPAASWSLDPGAVGAGGTVAPLPAPGAATPLGTHQVRVAVRAVGLNREDATAPGTGARARTWSEGAGLVLETGAGVDDLAPGDRVTGLFEGGFSPLAVTDRRVLVRIPQDWSYEDAAAVPLDHLTAYHALVDLAAIRPGESVLIHSAAEGTGLAAVQLARQMGARVFGTAPQQTWPDLADFGLGEEHLAPSHTSGFDHRLRAANGGRGLDAVLHTLPEEFLDPSLGLLRSPADGAGVGGRLVHVAATGHREDSQVAESHPGRGYHALDLADTGPERIERMLHRIMELFSSGALRLGPVTSYDVRDVREALDVLRPGGTTGKVVLTLPAPFPQEGTVLVTGRAGRLGHRVARHLVTGYGVRHLLLVHPEGAAALGQDERTAELRALGARVSVRACDLADRTELERLLAEVPQEHPLRAVVHTAGADPQSPGERSGEELFRTRAQESWNLHELTSGLDLASFVVFSSSAGTLGTPGRSGQAAVDVFHEALAHRRRGFSLPALSLAWGPWSGSGEAPRPPDGRGARGPAPELLVPMPADRALAQLDAALYLERDALVCALTDPGRVHGVPLLSGLASGPDGPVGSRAPEPEAVHPQAPRPRVPDGSATGAPGTGDPSGTEQDPGARPPAGAERLAGLTPPERERLVLAGVRAHTADVLGHTDADGGGVPPERPFRELGMESMDGVELCERLEDDWGTRLPDTAVFDHPTPVSLARFVLDLLFPRSTGGTEAEEEVQALGAGTAEHIDGMDVNDLLKLALGPGEPRPDGGQETADGYR
ncbi:hypothetical protein GCM10007079_45980 [Nocardiopsis terrae]|uniref:Acyl transferase domain-containing protein/acyl carrier protein n=3 Tax=Nocardiopsis terrae TaxID=372655 RepID=A0ABR9HKP2_9ACTN|nr:type I polyketide synthase [Nocardiopsis terrae]MBE1459595.1 acyl transferase domain-containing protein/acyl carrier protein [Nocardiopsis terrae]GHC94951.1 hypothetical protein GCM10007079_45980 [Nocardiopsis terrae]